MDNLISQFVVGIGGIGAGAWAMLAANSVQEAQDLAAIATATTLGCW